MGLAKKIGMMAAGFGISGAIGAISGVLLLYVLIDAAIAGADEAVSYTHLTLPTILLV